MNLDEKCAINTKEHTEIRSSENSFITNTILSLKFIVHTEKVGKNVTLRSFKKLKWHFQRGFTASHY